MNISEIIVTYHSKEIVYTDLYSIQKTYKKIINLISLS